MRWLTTGRSRKWLLSLVLLALPALLATGVRSQSPNSGPSLRLLRAPSDNGSSDWVLFPEGGIYPVYLASPRTPRFGVNLLFVNSTDIPGTSKERLSISMGGQFGMFRFDKNWQIDFGAGYVGWFDRGFSLDNIGWDGLYTGSLSHRYSDRLALRLAFQHLSAHKGDEYVIRTNQSRVDYTREEWALGMRYDFTEGISGYLEGGWGVVFSNDNLQEPGRLEAGLEFQDSLPEWHPGLGWYLAGDFESMEERNWQIDSRLGFGFSFKRRERMWRLGLQYNRGRVPLGEFFQSDENYVGFGFWMQP